MPLPKFCAVASTSTAATTTTSTTVNNKKRGKPLAKNKVDDETDKVETTVNDNNNNTGNKSNTTTGDSNISNETSDEKKKAATGKSNEKEGKNNDDKDDVCGDEDNEENECDGDDDEDDDDDDDDDDDASCLHCHSSRSAINKQQTGIQVRCDECGSYICNACHWCHEFQANHEIRVCDRCDAFYCRSCDEMDQCDDCGEVVCATCSTLLSCKFCGGGLCEDCATACGRCGIVLCSKDAKFAVDCDTCRLSYCLVCLASGNKDPCVRCGHRPSKRMEQLVHLRLKSIYKAFKQSSSSTAASTMNGSGGGGCSNTNSSATAAGAAARSSTNSTGTATTSNSTTASGRSKNQHPRHSNGTSSNSNTADVVGLDEYDLSDDPAALMMAAAATASAVHKATTAASKGSHNNNNSNSHHNGSFSAGAGLAAASVGTSYAAKHKREAAAAAAAAAAATSSTNAVKEAVEKYKAEKAKADAAAAALLAELDEEEEQVNAKKRKKKKKKQQQRQQSAGEDDDNGDDRKMTASTASTSTPLLGSSSNSLAPKTKLKDPPASSYTLSRTPMTRYAAIQDDDSDDDDDDGSGQQKIKDGQRGTPSPSTANRELHDASSHESEEAVRVGGGSTNSPAVDTLEQAFESLEEEENIQGLNDLLASIKGVPGRAVLRKNIKKAVKRFKAAAEAAEAELRAQQEEEEEEEEEVIALPSVSRQSPSIMMMDINNRRGAVTPVMPEGALRTSDLLKIVPVGAVPACPSLPGTAPRVVKAATANTASPIRSECVMKMSPVIVGWVIGKGGQRIRDLMDESGAKIWIDQDSMAPHEPRIVYVSGYRKNVDEAVRMIKDLVAKAPAETPQTNPQTKTAPVAAPHSAPADMTHQNIKAHPPGSAVGGGVAGLPDMTSTDSFRLRPRKTATQSHHGGSHSHHGRSNNGEAGRARHEITCDPRFVPLLIGRRGWTVKNIQDSSGARVDIDQTVTPRKITISGSDTSVEIAVRMVRDVLSYPHSQLHGTVGHHVAGGAPTTDNYVIKSLEDTDQPEHFPPPMNSEHFPKPEHFPPPKRPAPLPQAVPSPPAPVVVEQVESHPSAPSPIAVDEEPEPSKEMERSQTPPPSSLIMPGDAKSTISASSSLSSTPEPSMSSSSKGNIAAVAPGPMLLPVFGSGEQYHCHDSANDFIGFPPSSLLAPGANMGFGQAKDPSFGRPSPPFPLGGPGPSMLQSHHISRGAPMDNGMKPPAGRFPFGPIAGEHHTPLPMHQRSAFHSSVPGFPQMRPTPDSQRSIVSPLQPTNRSGTMSMPGMWNQATVPSHGPRPGSHVGPEGFGLAAAVDFLHHSTSKPIHPATLPAPMPPHQGSGGIGASGFMGIPNSSPSMHQPEFTSIGLERGLNQQMLNPGTPGREDSRIVDSLFGPSDLGLGIGATGIVDGLQGISLGSDAACPGLWDTMPGSTETREDSLKALCGGLGDDLLVNPIGTQEQPAQCSLFSTTSDPMHNMDDNINIHIQHPPHSRFAWGEGHQRDG